MRLLKLLQNKKIKLFLKIKEKNVIHCKKLTSKIFYNLTYIYIKNNFLLINKLIQYNTFSNIISKKPYILNDLNIYNDSFILNYLDHNLNNKAKTMININKTKKPLSIILSFKKDFSVFNNRIKFLFEKIIFVKIKIIYNGFFVLFIVLIVFALLFKL